MRGRRDPATAEVSMLELARTEACPFEAKCPCRRGPWCHSKKILSQGKQFDYRMLTLEGCRDGHCDRPCAMLLHVEDLADRFLRAAGIDRPPVPLDLIGTFDPDRPVEIRFIPLNAHYGAVWLVDNEWVLHLNANQPLFVNRYVAFHEGYHIFCRASAMRAGDSGDSCRSFNEIIADYFAASVLMPRGWLLEWWPRVRSTSLMAEIFQAPEPAIAAWVRRWVCV